MVSAETREYWQQHGYDFAENDDTVVLEDDDIIVVEDTEDSDYGSDPILPPTNPNRVGCVVEEARRDGEVTQQYLIREGR